MKQERTPAYMRWWAAAVPMAGQPCARTCVSPIRRQKESKKRKESNRCFRTWSGQAGRVRSGIRHKDSQTAQHTHIPMPPSPNWSRPCDGGHGVVVVVTIRRHDTGHGMWISGNRWKPDDVRTELLFSRTVDMSGSRFQLDPSSNWKDNTLKNKNESIKSERIRKSGRKMVDGRQASEDTGRKETTDDLWPIVYTFYTNDAAAAWKICVRSWMLQALIE